jgi:hypothetical protein
MKGSKEQVPFAGGGGRHALYPAQSAWLSTIRVHGFGLKLPWPVVRIPQSATGHSSKSQSLPDPGRFCVSDGPRLWLAWVTWARVIGPARPAAQRPRIDAAGGPERSGITSSLQLNHQWESSHYERWKARLPRVNSLRPAAGWPARGPRADGPTCTARVPRADG